MLATILALVRVDVSAAAAHLTFTARRIPTEVAWAILVILLLTHGEGSLKSRLGSASLILVYTVFGTLATWRRASESFADVVEEVTQRVALANGDPAPAARKKVVRPGPRADEWICACDAVNKRSRTTCARCWAQRPDKQE
jgi:hypothetical protein